MPDRPLQNGSSRASSRPPEGLADHASQPSEVERGASIAPVAAIGFSVLGLASRIESWSSAPSVR